MFFNPEIPGLGEAQYLDFGIENAAGHLDSGLRSLEPTKQPDHSVNKTKNARC